MAGIEMKVLAEWKYEKSIPFRGYTGKTLYVNVENQECIEKEVTEEMKERFTGGRGFGLKLLWDAVKDNTKWDDPENEIIISGGPLCGVTQYPGLGKFYAVFISPLSGQTYDSNAGGHFGPLLKFAGWDALEIQGKSSSDVVIFIDGDNGKVQFLESDLKDLNSYTITESLHDYFSETEDDKRSVSVVSTGQAAEHTYWGCLNSSFYDLKRKTPRLKQAGRGGGGTILRNKKIVALVVRNRDWSNIKQGIKDFGILQEVGLKLHKEIHDLDAKQARMRTVGTAHLNEIMNDYHLLPTHNFKFGQHKDIANIHSNVYEGLFTQGVPDGCWYGCSMACSKGVDNFEIKTGPCKGQIVTVDGPEYETSSSLGPNIGIMNPAWTIEANFYADHYGFDTIGLGTGLAFVCECFEKGFINQEITNGLDLNFGNMDNIMKLIHRMAEGKDTFANEVSKGIRQMKKVFEEKYGAPAENLRDIGMEGQGIEVSEYVCKESIAQWGGFFLTLKGPQHDEAWLIFMDRVNKQLPTFEDKAEALHYFPLFRTWFSLIGGCKLPWNDVEPADNMTKYPPQEAAKVPEHVQNYVDIFNAVTGRSITKEDLLLMSEKVYNFQHLFQIRLGKGTRDFHNIPYRAMGPVYADEWEARSEYYDNELREAGIEPERLPVEEKISKLRVIREQQWITLVDAVYNKRGWDRNGIPTLEKLREIDMELPELVKIVKEKAKPEDSFTN